MSTSFLREAADGLWDAELQRIPIAPLTEVHPKLGIAEAYGIQKLNTERRVEAGGVIRGRKVGLTSDAMQKMLGVDEPDFGVLFDDMLVEDAGAVDMTGLVHPRVEAEIAFVLASDLEGPGTTVDDVLAATLGVRAALEIIDSRVVDWRIKLMDTIADNASSARFVLGRDITPVDGLDLPGVKCALAHDGTVVEEGVGAAALGDPAACVAWLANKLAEFGDRLQAGEVIMPGALHRAVDVQAGDEFTAEFSDIGSVSVRFV